MIVPLVMLALQAASAIYEEVPGLFPIYNPVVTCSALAQSPNPDVKERGGNDCVDFENTMKDAALQLWPSIPEASQKHCRSIGNYGGGSYPVLYQCAMDAFARKTSASVIEMWKARARR